MICKELVDDTGTSDLYRRYEILELEIRSLMSFGSFYRLNFGLSNLSV